MLAPPPFVDAVFPSSIAGGYQIQIRYVKIYLTSFCDLFKCKKSGHASLSERGLIFYMCTSHKKR